MLVGRLGLGIDLSAIRRLVQEWMLFYSNVLVSDIFRDYECAFILCL